MGLTRGKKNNFAILVAPTEKSAKSQLVDTMQRQVIEETLEVSREAARTELKRAARTGVLPRTVRCPRAYYLSCDPLIEQTMLNSSQSGSAKLPTQRIATIENTVPGTIADDCHAHSVSQILRNGAHSTGHEYQGATTVGGCKGCGLFYGVNVEVPTSVIHPGDIVRTVEVTDLANGSRRGDRVGGAEEDHPVATQLDCFLIRHAVVPRLRRLTAHGSSVHQATVSNADREES